MQTAVARVSGSVFGSLKYLQNPPVNYETEMIVAKVFCNSLFFCPFIQDMTQDIAGSVSSDTVY